MKVIIPWIIKMCVTYIQMLVSHSLVLKSFSIDVIWLETYIYIYLISKDFSKPYTMGRGIMIYHINTMQSDPLFEACDPCVFNNYRPVSLLCVLSKVYEKIMYNRLKAFLENFDILFENQFGFRKLHSSYMALMVLTDKLIRSLENGEFVIGVYLEFSKAFDTVDHEILLSKLSHYGIRGNCLNWFQSYLSNRKQFVTYNGVSSPVNRITCGVPQGSILGPLLFLLYINYLGIYVLLQLLYCLQMPKTYLKWEII